MTICKYSDIFLIVLLYFLTHKFFKMIKDRNSVNTIVPTQEIQAFEKFLKKRKSFEDIPLQEIKNISCVGIRRLKATNYKCVFVIKRGNVFTYLAFIKKKKSKNEFLKWYCSFSDVLVAAKAVDKKLLEHGFAPVNFNFKAKLKDQKAKIIAA